MNAELPDIFSTGVPELEAERDLILLAKVYFIFLTNFNP